MRILIVVLIILGHMACIQETNVNSKVDCHPIELTDDASILAENVKLIFIPNCNRLLENSSNWSVTFLLQVSNNGKDLASAQVGDRTNFQAVSEGLAFDAMDWITWEVDGRIMTPSYSHYQPSFGGSPTTDILLSFNILESDPGLSEFRIAGNSLGIPLSVISINGKLIAEYLSI